MRAKVTTAFPGRPDREVKTRTIEVGEIIDGELAEVAVREKWAEEVQDEQPAEAKEKKVEDMTVPELKALAEDKKIDLGAATKKGEILALVQKALAAPAKQ